MQRGTERGEVRSDADDAMVVDVLPAMMMYHSKVRGSEWWEESGIAEVIDRKMVPLLRRQAD
jgi:hypothetical protein